MLSRLALARRLWLRLPPDLRRLGHKAIIRLLSPRAAAPPPPPQPGAAVTVAGLLGSVNGLGEGARLCAETLERLGYPVDRINLSAAFGQTPLLDPSAPPPLTDGAGGAMIIHLNAPDMPAARLLIGRSRAAGRRVIGYWAWELPRIPPEWRVGFRHVHEVWTPSAFCADAIRACTDRPVRVAPHPVATPSPSARRRADFGLPENAFVVLSMLHFGSGFARKNPLAAVRAFRQAFGDRSDALLAIKLSADAALPWARRELAAAIDGAPNIKIIEETLSRGDQAALLQAADVVLSLHRSEGFGLAPAEAMRLGKPVVATGWSGNLEFMTPDCACLVDYRLIPVVDPQGTYDPDQYWADPDPADAARRLLQLQENPDFAAALGDAARRHVETRLGDAAYAAAVSASLPAPVGANADGRL